MAASVEIQQFALRDTAAGNGTQDIIVSGQGGGDCRTVVFFLSGAVTNGTVRAPLKHCIGWIDTAGNNMVGTSTVTQNGVTTSNTSRYWSLTDCITVLSDDAASVDGTYQFDSYITDGVRITTSNPAGQALLVTAVLFYGADVTGKAFTITPTSGSVDVETKVNIGQDTDCLFASHIDSTLAADTLDPRSWQNFGVATWDGTTIRQVGNKLFATDNVANSDVKQAGGGARVEFNFTGATAINRATEVTTMDGDEVGITSREEGMPTDRPYRFLSLNFNGKIEARVEELGLPTSGNFSSTAYGFKPQAMVFSIVRTITHVTETGVYESQLDNLSIWGAMDGTREFSSSVMDDDAAATMDTASLSNNSALILADVDDSIIVDGDFSSFDANGFTITMNTNPGAALAGFGVAFQEEATGVSHEYLPAHAARVSSNRRLRM